MSRDSSSATREPPSWMRPGVWATYKLAPYWGPCFITSIEGTTVHYHLAYPFRQHAAIAAWQTGGSMFAYNDEWEPCGDPSTVSSADRSISPNSLGGKSNNDQDIGQTIASSTIESSALAYSESDLQYANKLRGHAQISAGNRSEATTAQTILNMPASSTARIPEPVWLWGLLQEKPRDAVIQFAVAMERELKANDHKGGWEDCPLGYLFRRIKEEISELESAVSAARVDQQRVCSEAADVANFAMMIADVCASLPQLPAKAVPSAIAAPSKEPQ